MAGRRAQRGKVLRDRCFSATHQVARAIGAEASVVSKSRGPVCQAKRGSIRRDRCPGRNDAIFQGRSRIQWSSGCQIGGAASVGTPGSFVPAGSDGAISRAASFWAGNFYQFTSRRFRRDSDRAIEHCDLLNLPNNEELKFLTERKAAIVEPYGLNQRDRASLTGAMQPAETRLQKKEICFIGMWSLRKGARDWPEIIRRIRGAIPDAKFKLLGTMINERSVLKELNLSQADGVSCVSIYDPDQLPLLLGSCAVGLFPSYIEGFGLAVLEQLACGIPTIAYDVTGPREMLNSLRELLLVPEADVQALVDRALEILRMNGNDYSTLSARCRSIADQFRWDRIAADTANEYQAALEKVRAS